MVGLLAGLTLGALACALIAHWISIRWRLPWSGTLAYFGILDWHDDPALGAGEIGLYQPTYRSALDERPA
jgi:hypothetical protein